MHVMYNIAFTATDWLQKSWLLWKQIIWNAVPSNGKIKNQVIGKGFQLID